MHKIKEILTGGPKSPQDIAAEEARKRDQDAKDAAKDAVDQYIKALGIKYVGVYFDEKASKDTGRFVLKVETGPGGVLKAEFNTFIEWDAIVAASKDGMKLGFVLGQISRGPTGKALSLKITDHSIEAPNPEIITHYFTQQLQALGRQ